MRIGGISMSQVSADEEKLKQLVKAAVIEVLEERRDLLQEAIREALEDIALVRAIEEGEQTNPAARADVLSVLDHGR
jgi:hypothetical protein